jgi:hypothetical protein
MTWESTITSNLALMKQLLELGKYCAILLKRPMLNPTNMFMLQKSQNQIQLKKNQKLGFPKTLSWGHDSSLRCIPVKCGDNFES